MRILVAPDSFKGTLTSVEAAEAMAAACRRACPDAEIIQVPLADGGAGTLAVIARLVPGVMRSCRVSNPLGRPIRAHYLLAGRRGFIEMAQASGLTLVPEKKRDAGKTTSYGTGQMILSAAESGCRRLFVGLGGSATNDGGMGALSALGVRFLRKDGSRILPGSGDTLASVASIDASGMPAVLKEVSLTLLCDVTNPLTGRNGATAVYGPQKGADRATIIRLERGMRHYARVLERTVRTKVAAVAGAGAAGGLAAGLLAFFPCRIVSGIKWVLECAGFDEKLSGADLLLTGEGRIDRQTAFGKTLGELFSRAEARGIPVIAIGGTVSRDAASLRRGGRIRLVSMAGDGVSFSDAVEHARSVLMRRVEEALRAHRP